MTDGFYGLGVAPTSYPGRVLAAEAPKITDWMQAWGSVVGLALSGVAALATWLLLRHEIRVRREEQRDNEAAHARLVVGFVTEVVTSQNRVVGARWLIANHSSAPIFNVDVTITNWALDQRGMFVGDSDKFIEILQPGSNQTGSVSFVRDWPEELVNRDQMVAAADFYDSSGIHWHRKGTEVPERLVDPFTLEPGFIKLAWLYLWPLSAPPRWIWYRCRDGKRRIEAHMRMRVWNRRHGKVLKHLAIPTRLRTPDARRSEHGGA